MKMDLSSDFKFPLSANDIYLEDDTKQVKAVCSSHDIAIRLADYAN